MICAPAPLLLAPNKPPLLAVLPPKRPLADDAPVPAAAGAPIGISRNQQFQKTQILQSKFATKGPPPALISGSGCTLYFLQIFKYIVCSCPTYLPIKLSISSLGEDRSIKSMTKACHSTSFTSPYLSAKHHFARIVLLVDLDHTLFVCLIGVRFKGKSTSS